MLIIEERAVYTTKELAEILKMKPVTIERKIKRKEIKASKIGREYRILGRDILLLFEWKNKFKILMDEIGADIKNKGFKNEDVISAISDVRRNTRA
jgi:excisionase family DNA binding protein